MSGEIPPELGNLASLTQLVLGGNQLTGEIPPELGNLANLEWLYLSDNQLSGEIPPELGNLTNLTGLYLSRNQLSGEIPPELGNLAYLIGLGLLGNQLGGCVPSSFLERLEEEKSDVGGFLFCPMSTPQPIAGRPMAQTPPETDREALVALYNATGGPYWDRNDDWLSDVPISEWYGVTTDDNDSVTSLDLNRNQLSGEIPPELGNLAYLTWLYLDGNQLSGCVPSSLSGRLDMEYSDLGGLPFCP